MTPTILREHDDCSGSLRGVRKTETSSSFSVINYAGRKRKRLDQSHGILVNKIKDDAILKMVVPVLSSPVSSPSAIMITEDTSSSFSSEHYTSSEITNSIKSEEDFDDYPNRNRSYSISSSGCSTSMGEVSPLSIPPYRCSTAQQDSEFEEDDGFRDDNTTRSSISSNYAGGNIDSIPIKRINTKGLVDIALRTIKLIRRNQELQARLAELKSETNAFIQSVLLNPQNQSLKTKIEN